MVEFWLPQSLLFLVLARAGQIPVQRRRWGGAMKYARKFLSFAVLGAMLLAAIHSHVRQHQVPHPHAVKVSLAKRAVPRPQPALAPAAVAVPTAENLITIGFVTTPGTVVLLETKQSSCHLRGPPS